MIDLDPCIRNLCVTLADFRLTLQTKEMQFRELVVVLGSLASFTVRTSAMRRKATDRRGGQCRFFDDAGTRFVRATRVPIPDERSYNTFSSALRGVGGLPQDQDPRS